MQKFSLDIWLKDKSRKVVTRDGRPVRILCTDAKAKDGCCIIAAIETDGEEEGYQFFEDGKAYSSKSSIEDCADLFFADEEEELTEFEKEVESIMNNDAKKIIGVKYMAKRLLDLARKEILKDLPKWKKFLEEYKELDSHAILLEDNERVVLTEYLEKGDYYIELSELEKLPKEE